MPVESREGEEKAITLFVKGLVLNEAFYQEAVRPVLAEVFPRLAYSVGRLGSGSDVLGYDTPRSTDHDWGPRLELFLTDEDCRRYADAITGLLAERLPRRFAGYPVGFTAPDPADNGTQLLDYEADGAGPLHHRVSVQTVGAFCHRRLGFDPRPGMAAHDWLACSEQALLELTAGAVYHDGLGELASLRQQLAYYPHDVWLFRLAAQWQRIAQEEPFVGRCGEVGDDTGSRIVAARLARDLMRLALLLERRYAPYSKWLGTAFAALPLADSMEPQLTRAMRAATWAERGAAIAAASELAARRQNELGLMPPLDPTPRPFFDRPFPVLFAGRFADALVATIGDDWLRRQPLCGGIDQFCDSTDVLSYPAQAQRLRALYGE